MEKEDRTKHSGRVHAGSGQKPVGVWERRKPRRAREAQRVERRRPTQMDVGPMTHMALSKVIPTFLGWVVREGH